MENNQNQDNLTEEQNKVSEKSSAKDALDSLVFSELNDEEKEQLLAPIKVDLNAEGEGKVAEVALESVVKEKIEDAVKLTEPKKRKKNIFVSVILLAINLVIVFFLAKSLFSSAEDASIINLIGSRGKALNYLWCVLGCFIVAMLADTCCLYALIKHTTGQRRPFLAYKAAAVGKYYEAVTPLSAGGQPAQLIYLAKRKISPGVATSIPIIRTTLLNLFTILVAIVSFLVFLPKLPTPNSFLSILTGILKILAYIGIVFNTFYLVTIMTIAFSRSFGRSLARTIVKVQYKLHLVKDYRKAYRKLINHVIEFQASLKYLKSDWRLLLSCMISIIVEVLAYASVPFFIVLALSGAPQVEGLNTFTFLFVSMAMYYVCFMASAYIPLPGGTGMMEISFVILFTPYIGMNFVAWGFLIWRLGTYYLSILQGIVIIIGDMIASVIKPKRVKNTVSEVAQK